MRVHFLEVALLVAASASAHLTATGSNGNGPATAQGLQAAAPPEKCYWDGTAPFCAGNCSPPYTECGRSACGDGACCITGWKKYCCLDGCPTKVPLLDPKPGHDDFCPVDRHLCCPPGAKSNEDCECVGPDARKAKRSQ